jgi:hypothetical protein
MDSLEDGSLKKECDTTIYYSMSSSVGSGGGSGGVVGSRLFWEVVLCFIVVDWVLWYYQ